MIAKDEQRQWDAMCKVGKTRFVTGVFVRIFLLLLVGAVISQVVHWARTKQWSGSDLAFGILFAVLISVAFTIIGGVGTWQDLERKFAKPETDIR